MTDQEVKDTTVINRCIKQISKLDSQTRKAVVTYLYNKFNTDKTNHPSHRSDDGLML